MWTAKNGGITVPRGVQFVVVRTPLHRWLQRNQKIFWRQQMIRKKFAQALLIVACALCAFHVSAQTTVAPKNKVVFQVSDGDAGKWSLAANNAKNVQDSYGAEKVLVEIVVYGPGIGMLKAGSTASNRVAELVKSGVQVVACENTMAAMKLTKDDMNPAISYVPAGVVEIMKRQGEGWAYVRP
jgi:hypothetical protein